MENQTKIIERLNLEDGRIAERHTSTNESGEKVVELFVEPKKALTLEKRIVEKRKEILAEQVIETIKDGQVVDVQVHSMEPNVKLQLREHIAVAENSDINPPNYVSKQDLAPVVAQAVVAGMSALMEDQRLSAQNNNNHIVTKAQQAEQAIGKRVEEKSTSTLTYVCYGAGILLQIVVLGAMAFLM